jgi:hypothetical protein
MKRRHRVLKQFARNRSGAAYREVINKMKQEIKAHQDEFSLGLSQTWVHAIDLLKTQMAFVLPQLVQQLPADLDEAAYKEAVSQKRVLQRRVREQLLQWTTQWDTNLGDVELIDEHLDIPDDYEHPEDDDLNEEDELDEHDSDSDDPLIKSESD